MSLVVIFCFFTTVLWADVLDPIEVTASKDASEFSFGSSYKIRSKELEAAPLALTSRLIESVPGVISNQNGGPGGRVSFFLRGTESRHVAFTLDNLRLNDPSNTDRQFDAAFFTNPFIREITVFKGPQAVLFGSDALGGLISMKTRKGEDAPATKISVSGGSFGTISGSLGQDWKSRQHQGSLTVLDFRTDGISRLNKKRYNARERDSAQMKQIVSSSRHRWSSKWETDFLASLLRGENELDGSTDDNNHDKSVNNQYILQQKTSLDVSKTLSFSLRNGLNQHERDIRTFATGKNLFRGSYLQNELLIEKKSNTASLLGGLAHEEEQFNRWNFHLYSIFLQGLKRISDVSFQAGLRQEEHSRYGSFSTGSAGLSYDQFKHTFSLQFSQGFKAPSLYQLNAPPYLGSPVGNKDLAPERNSALEFNVKRDENFFEYELSVFRNHLTNLIVFTNAGYRNQGNFNVQGFELAGKVKSERWSLAPSFTHQDFLDNETAILRRPQETAQIILTFLPVETVELSVKGRALSQRKDLTPSGKTVKLNPYQTLDLGFKFYDHGVEYGVQILNIQNRVYEDLYGYSVMPRSIFGSVGWTL